MPILFNNLKELMKFSRIYSGITMNETKSSKDGMKNSIIS